MNFDVLKTNVEETVGEKSFGYKEMLYKIFPESVEDELYIRDLIDYVIYSC
jgi:hypothetical protein